MTMAARDVSWGVGGRMIVDGVTLEAAPGKVLGLIGPNGSGKSSLLRRICRLRKVAGGIITLDGADIGGFTRQALARRIAFVEQQGATEAQLTVRDVVRLGRTPHRGPLSPWSRADEDAVARALARTGLAGHGGQAWHTLSGGERQRAHIARALAQEPTELVLDEPTNHLDIRHQLEILKLVRRLGTTCIVAIHDLNLAAMFCDEVAVLNAGRVVAAGAPAAVLTAELIWDVFGVKAVLRAAEGARRSHIEYLVD